MPFGVTVDFDTVEDDTVTLRERDSMTQRRVPIAALPGLLRELWSGRRRRGVDGRGGAYPEVGSSEASGRSLSRRRGGVFSRPAALVKK